MAPKTKSVLFRYHCQIGWNKADHNSEGTVTNSVMILLTLLRIFDTPSFGSLVHQTSKTPHDSNILSKPGVVTKCRTTQDVLKPDTDENTQHERLE